MDSRPTKIESGYRLLSNIVSEECALFTFRSDSAGFTDKSTQTMDPSLQARIWQLSTLLDESLLRRELREIVPGVGDLLVQIKPGADVTLSRLIDVVNSLWPRISDNELPWEHSRIVQIPVVYGGSAGPDLAEVARQTDLAETEVIKRHCASRYTVFCLGFQPGFAYLGGLDSSLSVPRRATPRVRIPAGSVAIGGSQTGIYPAVSPGGWHIIGHTPEILFDVNRKQASLLRAGDTVEFVQVTASC